ncbi:MAG: hypothetical protein ACR2HF_12325 [Methylococcaceae bacterium]
MNSSAILIWENNRVAVFWTDEERIEFEDKLISRMYANISGNKCRSQSDCTMPLYLVMLNTLIDPSGVMDDLIAAIMTKVPTRFYPDRGDLDVDEEGNLVFTTRCEGTYGEELLPPLDEDIAFAFETTLDRREALKIIKEYYRLIANSQRVKKAITA